jgi:phage shock protein PspC (stress-responsive transcriptional regulator)
MYCKNCGKEVNEKAIACIHCGVPPFSERKFCQECGCETKENQIVCIKCGVSLETVSRTTKLKEKEEYEGFYRSSDEKVLAGVCGGLAHKYKTKPITMRVLAVFVPFGFILYLVALTLPVLPTKVNN